MDKKIFYDWLVVQAQKQQPSERSFQHKRLGVVKEGREARWSNPPPTHYKESEDDTRRAKEAAHENPEIALKAASHLDANQRTLEIAAKHPNSAVAHAALDNPNAGIGVTEVGAQHLDKTVAMKAVTHTKSRMTTVNFASNHPDGDVALEAVTNDLTTPEALYYGVRHSDPRVAHASLKSRRVDEHTVLHGVFNPDGDVALRAITHRLMSTMKPSEARHIATKALKHRDPRVIREAQKFLQQNPETNT